MYSYKFRIYFGKYEVCGYIKPYKDIRIPYIKFPLVQSLCLSISFSSSSVFIIFVFGASFHVGLVIIWYNIIFQRLKFDFNGKQSFPLRMVVLSQHNCEACEQELPRKKIFPDPQRNWRAIKIKQETLF